MKLNNPETQTNTVYIGYYDDISQAKAKAVMTALSDIVREKKPDTIYFLLSSNGGNVDAGVTLYNFLRGLPVKLIMHNIGIIGSIAVLVFLAADTRYACTHSAFNIHGASFDLNAITKIKKSELLELLNGTVAYENSFINIVAERTKLTIEAVAAAMFQGIFEGPAFALTNGIISEIRPPEVPPNAHIFSFNL